MEIGDSNRWKGTWMGCIYGLGQLETTGIRKGVMCKMHAMNFLTPNIMMYESVKHSYETVLAVKLARDYKNDLNKDINTIMLEVILFILDDRELIKYSI